MSVVLFSVRIATSLTQCPVRGDDCHSSGMLRQQYDTSAVVSARAHGFRILTGSFCRLTLYQLSECHTERIDNDTPAVLGARAHLLDFWRPL